LVLIDKAIPNLAFTNPDFAKDVLRQFTGERRQLIADALAYQASHFGNNIFAGLSGEYMEDQQRQFRDMAAVFPTNPALKISRERFAVLLRKCEPYSIDSTPLSRQPHAERYRLIGNFDMQCCHPFARRIQGRSGQACLG
jgi:hypothetical protein